MWCVGGPCDFNDSPSPKICVFWIIQTWVQLAELLGLWRLGFWLGLANLIWNNLKSKNYEYPFVILPKWCVCSFLITTPSISWEIDKLESKVKYNLSNNNLDLGLGLTRLSILLEYLIVIKYKRFIILLFSSECALACFLDFEECQYPRQRVQSRPSWQREAWFQLISQISSDHD